jgi:type I site-specific restriction endonuclease
MTIYLNEAIYSNSTGKTRVAMAIIDLLINANMIGMFCLLLIGSLLLIRQKITDFRNSLRSL